MVALRYFIVAGWIAAVAAAMASLPALTPSNGVAGLVPSTAPAVQAEVHRDQDLRRATRRPGGRRPARRRGLPTSVQEAAVRNAVNVDTGRATGSPISGLAGALPIPNTDAIFPGSRERSTTVLTYLYFRPVHLDRCAASRKRALCQPVCVRSG